MDLVGVVVDADRKQVQIYTKDLLVNQIRRETPKIAASFDQICETQLHQISETYANALVVLPNGCRYAEQHDDALRACCGRLLINAANTLAASVEVLRCGYVLQPGVLLRSFLEMIATALHLFVNPNDVATFSSGTFKSTRALAAAKSVLPPFGELYGFYSERFTHVSRLHGEFQPLVPYQAGDQALAMNVSMLKVATWLLYVTTELVFLDLVQAPRYWQVLGGGRYVYNPSADERSWQAWFLDTD